MENRLGLMLLCLTFRTSANQCGCYQQQQRYHLLSEFNNLNMTNPQFISELTPRTQFTCARECYYNNNCTMFINNDDGQCLLFSAFFPPVINSSTLHGARLYARVSDTCPLADGYVTFDNPTACYRLSLVKKTWMDAKADCEGDGGHLVVLEDVDKQQQVMEATAAIRDYCTVTKCSSHCRCNAACVVINYNTVTSVCQLHDASVLDSNATVEENVPEWIILEPPDGAPKFGEWTLVFRATAGLNQSALEEYTNSSHRDDQYTVVNNVPKGCLSLNGSIPCDRHYRSRYLDTWDQRGVSQVLLGLYKDGEMIVDVTFECTGCNVFSWFDLLHVTASPWTDLLAPETPHNYFSVQGGGSRHFIMNENYAGCENDLGWLVVIDQPGGEGCQWEANATSFPYFLTAAGETSTNWDHGNPAVADVMAIMVKV
ncbi:uncharacterized protein [Haliotis cracherodii]|uniref:uncharacterized protein n=1 Tax=Haliotis cracherodii TaxID=6455 RepID=UPI0039ED30A5